MNTTLCIASITAFYVVLWLQSPRWWWCDPRALLAGIGFIYLGSVPILHSIGIPVSVQDPHNIAIGCVLQNLGWTASLLLVKPMRSQAAISAILRIEHQGRNITPTAAPRTITWLLLLLICFLCLALSRNLFSGNFLVRDERAGEFYTQDRLILSMLIVGTTAAFLREWPSLSFTTSVIAIFIGLIYSIAMLGIGSRREVVQIAIPSLLAIIARTSRPILTAAVLVIAGSTSLLLIGWHREGIANPQDNTDPLLLATNIEFVIPPITFDYYSSSNIQHEYGKTILLGPLMLLPRVIFPWKPDDLGVRFVNEFPNARDGMGYAYLPATEFYLNFGYIGVFFGFLTLGYLIGKLFSRPPRSTIKAGLALLVFAYACDFNRGSIPTIMYQLTISMVGFLVTCHLLQRDRYRRPFEAPS